MAETRGFNWDGGAAAKSGMQFDGPQGAQWAASDTAPPEPPSARPRGIAWAGGETPGARFGPGAGAFGGQWDGPATPSVDTLVDTDGFALVLERLDRSERIAFSPAEPPYRDIKSVQWSTEVNALASWEAKVPANQELYDWTFSNAVVGYNGERRFHGVVTAAEPGTYSDGEITLSGYGPGYWAGHDHLSVSYRNEAAYRALQDVWLRVARKTDGRMRGEVVRPRPEHVNTHWIPDEPVEWSGTPMEVLKKAHGYAGMAFATDHSEPGGIYQSFVPGEELRDADWTPTQGGIKPSISAEGYHNQVTVVGAQKQRAAEPVTNDDRYQATVTAPRTEIEQVMDGQIHSRTESDDELDSEQACRARAETLLAEDRGQYTIGGSLDVTPGVRRVVPGYTYRVSEFDGAAPEIFTPVWASLRQMSQSYGPGEATVSLKFDDESGLVEHIRSALEPASAPQSIKRRDSQMELGDANYIAPAELTYAAGDGIIGSGSAGATRDQL